jgi:hypothetical protein
VSILPDPQRQGDIHFLFAKSLPYQTRLKLIVAFVAIGLLIQLLVNFWFGLIFLVVGMTLDFIKGYSEKPDVVGKEEWNQVTPDEYKKVKARQNQLADWDTDLFDITNPLGGFMFVVIALVCAGIYLFLYYILEENRLALYWGVDAAVLLAPHWIIGVRTFLKKDKLIIKIRLFEKMMERLSSLSEIQVLPMLSTKETDKGGRIPMDARLMVRFLNAPDYFMGMQIQISLNNVQGRYYPYLYCVLIAKKEAGFFGKRSDLFNNPPRNILFEKTCSNGVDVCVIRQRTTKNSGYHTTRQKATSIVFTALKLADQYLNKWCLYRTP